MRKGLDKPLEVTIVRDVIRVRSVRSRIEARTCGYIRISSFNEQTPTASRRRSRHHGAGAAREAQGLCHRSCATIRAGCSIRRSRFPDTFLERGEIVSTRGRDAEETQRFNARAGDLTKGKR